MLDRFLTRCCIGIMNVTGIYKEEDRSILVMWYVLLFMAVSYFLAGRWLECNVMIGALMIIPAFMNWLKRDDNKNRVILLKELSAYNLKAGEKSIYLAYALGVVRHRRITMIDVTFDDDPTQMLIPLRRLDLNIAWRYLEFAQENAENAN